MHTSLSVLMLTLLLLFSELTFSQNEFPPIDPQTVTIVRDSWGVPHIYGPTDASASYGLAWANAEDDFKSMQENVYAVRGRLGEVLGKEGAIADVAARMIRLRELVESRYHKDLSEDYRKLLEAYAQGVNDYAAKHPEEVLLKDVFPVTPQDIAQGYTLAVAFMTHLGGELGRVLDGTVRDFEAQLSDVVKGSNAIALSSAKMQNGETHLVINSHQPLEGPLGWYEAHLNSDEGLNIHGGTFPGGATIFLGANQYLAWAHTLNYPDFVDIFKLRMHPEDELTYYFDGSWLELEEEKFRFKVKVGPIKIPVSRKLYWSQYGPTLRGKKGKSPTGSKGDKNDFYSIRFPAMFGIKAGEQWYRMNKATSSREFGSALAMHGLQGMNILYADRTDKIFYLSNGHFPDRNPAYDWKQVLPGDTSATLWPADFKPVDSLPLYANPSCGYLFNTNNSPFFATCEEENLDSMQYNRTMGYLRWNNNRALRLAELLEQSGKLDYAQLKAIKYDNSWRNPAQNFVVGDLEFIFKMKPEDHPKVAAQLQLLKEWDRTTDTTSVAAATWALTIKYVIEDLMKRGRVPLENQLTVEEVEAALLYAKKHLMRNFGTIHVPLGELQRHVRGDKDYAIWGTPDVLTAMYTDDWKRGRFKSFLGDCFIQFVRYTDEGVKIETVNAFGASSKPDSPHYDDQMELFVNQGLKEMTLDRETVFEQAKRIYHPGE